MDEALMWYQIVWTLVQKSKIDLQETIRDITESSV